MSYPVTGLGALLLYANHPTESLGDRIIPYPYPLWHPAILWILQFFESKPRFNPCLLSKNEASKTLGRQAGTPTSHS